MPQLTQNNPVPAPQADSAEKTTGNKTNKRKRIGQPSELIAQEEGEIDLTTPAKISRSEGQPDPDKAPSLRSLQTQLSEAPRQSLQLDKDSIMYTPPTPSPSQRHQNKEPVSDTAAQAGITTTNTLPVMPSRPDNTSSLPQDDPKSDSESDGMIMNRVAGGRESDQNPGRPNLRGHLDRFTNSNMPKVHDAHPTVIFDNIDLRLIGEWERIQGSKLLAQLFGAYAMQPRNHQTLIALIFRAVLEITSAKNVAVGAPHQSQTSKLTPLTFLIHNLTAAQEQMLLSREVWSSTNITFRVTTLDPPCPDYLFTIKNLATKLKDDVFQVVYEVWHDTTTDTFLDKVSDASSPPEHGQSKQSLLDFISSMWIEDLDFRNKGNVLAPTYRIFASGAIIKKDKTWTRLHNYLATRDYIVKFQYPGTNVPPFKSCTLCHGADHPRGLCPFPVLKGWNGPTRKEDPPLNDPEYRINDTIPTRDRNRARVSCTF